jgi:nucleoside phosphorylase
LVDLLVMTAIVAEFAAVARRLGAGRTLSEDYRLNLAAPPAGREPLAPTLVGRAFPYRTHVAQAGPGVVAVVQAGIGPKRASRAARWAIEEFRPRRVLVLGVAGGLDDELATADAVWASSVVSADDVSDCIELPAGDNCVLRWVGGGLHRARIAQSAVVVASTAEKRRIRAQTAAIAVDMESLAFVKVCKAAGTTVDVVRVISDPVDKPLPREIGALIDEAGNPRLYRALRRILRRPALLPELLSLERDMKAAVNRLRDIGSSIRSSFRPDAQPDRGKVE